MPGQPGGPTFIARRGLPIETLAFAPFANVVSRDGSTIAGTSSPTSWRYRIATGEVQSIPTPFGGQATRVTSISGSGLVVGVWVLTSAQQGTARAWLWGGDGIRRDATCAEFELANCDNFVVAGDGVTTAFEGVGDLVLRHADGSCELLPDLFSTGETPVLRGLSGDGSTVIGQSGFFATRWRNGLPELIPIPLGGSPGVAILTMTSETGDVVAGQSGYDRTGDNDWIYSDEWGAWTLRDLLVSWGMELPPGRAVLTAISGDGLTLVGSLYDGPSPNDSARLFIARRNPCNDIDFNNDGLFPSEEDLTEYLRVLAGGACSTEPPNGQGCDSIDFNNDGITPSDDDLNAFLRVLAGGNCIE